MSPERALFGALGMPAGAQPAASTTLHCWRHPRARAAEGRCIGHTDLPVDPRRAKRLAHQIRAFARSHGLAPIVRTSPLARSRDVGRWLARWGWEHRVDPALAEVNFGAWDGRSWTEIPTSAIDTWCADFERHRPGGGESVAALIERVCAFDPGPARVVVTHGGWLSAAIWIEGVRRMEAGSEASSIAPQSDTWPAAPRHASHVRVRLSLMPAADVAAKDRLAAAERVPSIQSTA